MPRYKSLLIWEPFPYLLLFVLVVIAGSIRPDAAPIAFWIAAVLAGLAVIFFAITFVIAGRRTRANPDGDGNLRTLSGLNLLRAEHSNAAVSPFVTVADTQRHQAAIDTALARGGEHPRAVLIPRASRWLSPRYRVGVQLLAGDRIRHAGFLPEAVERNWADRLDTLRARNTFAEVPARIKGAGRPYLVEIDLSGLETVLAEPGTN